MFAATAGRGRPRVIANDLPDEIVQPLVQLGRALLEHTRSNRDRSLVDHEEGVLGALRTAAPKLLEAVLQLATTGLEAKVQPIAARCPRCQPRPAVHSRRTRQV